MDGYCIANVITIITRFIRMTIIVIVTVIIGIAAAAAMGMIVEIAVVGIVRCWCFADRAFILGFQPIVDAFLEIERQWTTTGNGNPERK